MNRKRLLREIAKYKATTASQPPRKLPRRVKHHESLKTTTETPVETNESPSLKPTPSPPQPSSSTPPTTWETFPLKPALLKGILAFGFESPSQVQQLAVDPIIRGRDVIVQSQSGTGKTGVFCISVLQIIKEHEKHAQAILLSPTRELAEQSSSVIQSIGDYLHVSVRTCIGGGLFKEDVKALENGCQIVSGTPGRVYDMIKRGHLNTRRIAVLVIDEADEMIGTKAIISDIYRQLPSGVQVVLVSATMSKQVLDMSREFMNDPVKILVKREDVSLQGIAQYHVFLESEQKFDALCSLYNALVVQQAVFFCNTRKRVDWLAAKLKHAGFGVSSMHGEMDQKQRESIMAQFRAGTTRTLVTTDVWGRGIDVQQVSLVVNFDLPISKELYIHRIGRSGRWGRRGLAVSFCTREDQDMLSSIEKHFKIRIPVLPRDVKALAV